MEKVKDCKHKRIRKNYPFGKKSTAQKSCRDCGKWLSNREIRLTRKAKVY